ncbi:exonuclease mut-7 homolog isoform X2 [Megachile rotundata]|uniref:exonuclease mut-7 homolog isoform X2 n=1 Tax=Megachile rotundata TaxID=143995 RepID=UPI003FD317B1
MTTEIQKSDNSFADDLTFFSLIDDTTREWLHSLNHIWQLWKKCDSVTKTLIEYFESAPNPYLSTIRILVNTSDFKHMKPNSSLAFTVIEEYTKWLEPRRDMYEHFLELDLKLATFRLITTQNNMQFIKMVAITYDFISHNVEFLSIIQKMIDEQKYKEAAQYVIMLQLQDRFTNPETLLLPLTLQNKLIIVEELLANCPEMQKALVTYLDNLIGPDVHMHVILDELIKKNIQHVNMSTTQIKPMTKLIARLVKLYNLPPEFCPNLNRKRCEGALQFLIHKRYVDGSLSTPSWREMVQETIGNDIKLQLHMIRLLIHAQDTKEGLYWAKEFNIPKEQWPWAIVYEEEHVEPEGINEGASTSRSEISNSEDNTDTTNCHELRLSKDSIKIIDNARSFEEFLDTGLKSVFIVGIDSEWKPCFGTKQTEIALIQIATETNVYILDVTTMGNKSPELWTELALTLFENKNILKLGFGIAQDMSVMRESLPALSKIKTHGQGYVDIVHLWQILVNDYKFVFPHESNDHCTKQSLSKLVELCLGQKLNKSDQFSNWEQRPLRSGQITYAALDAYCLLEIYGVLEKQCERLDIPFLEICTEIQHIPHRSPKRNTKKATPNQTSTKPARSENFQQPRHQNKQEYPNRPIRSNNPRHPNTANGPVAHLRNQQFANKPNHIRRENSMIETSQNQIKINEFQVPAHKWRVVCDSMLGGLTSKLRMCGCDCAHVGFDQNGERSLKIAVNENRVLLTRNRNYLQFSKYLKPNRYYLVIADRPDDQLREVLEYFRVLVTQRDVFSRCQICNSDEFAKVPKSVMDKLVKNFVKITRENNYRILASTANDSSVQDNYYANNALQCEDRTWILSTNTVLIDSCLTKYLKQIQINKIPINVLRNVQVYYVCENCGQVYWNGSHIERTLKHTIKDIISK